jgi:hypothetical protein
MPPKGSCWAWRAALQGRDDSVRDQLVRACAREGIRKLEAHLKEMAK